MTPDMRTGQITQGRVAVVNMEEAACATSYNALLSGDRTLAESTWSGLQAGQQEWGLVVDGRPLCTVLRPRFITESRCDELARVSETLASLFERLGDRLLSSDRLLDRIGASDSEREIWAIHPGFPGFTLTSRLDSFMVGTQPRFIEYNAESPAGIAFCDALTSIFRSLPAFRQWEPAAAMGEFDARRRLLDTLLWAFREHGGTGTPTIAIADWEGVITRRDFELCADYFREQGVPTVIVDPRELEYRQGKVWRGNEQITLVYRRVLLHELLDKADEAHGLLDAYRDGAICMVNSPRSKLLHKKAVLALISDGSAGIEISEEEAQAIDRCIPWTRVVEAGRTTYEGREVDLARFIVQERERFAIKPTDDYGGRGVVLGWESDADTWEQAIERAMLEPHVVQERVSMPQGEFPIWDDGIAVVPLLVDTDPLLFRSEMGGVLTRMSAESLLNVSAGTGSAAPTFVVPEGD